MREKAEKNRDPRQHETKNEKNSVLKKRSEKERERERGFVFELLNSRTKFLSL